MCDSKGGAVSRLRITVAYTLPFREDLGVSEEIYQTERDSATVREVLELIVDRHPSMSRFVDASGDEAQRRHLVVAVNSKLAKLSDHVHEGDGVRVLLPVSGGLGE
jgi:molybdopterin converting factor small subunit